MIDRSNVLLQGIVGSTAYGLANEGSDIDQLGVYAAPADVVLGLNGSSLDDLQSPQSVDDSLVKHEPDLTLHEVGKYVSLALKANPTVLELLFLPTYTVESDGGAALFFNRHLFLSSHFVKARYGGYARAQLHRLMNRQAEGREGFSSDVGARTEKHGRHCARLILQAQEILRNGTLTVHVGEHRGRLFELGRLASEDPSAFEATMIPLLDNLDEIKSPLPEYPDRDAVNRLLVGIRRLYL